MALDVLHPLFMEVESKLSTREKEQAMNRLVSLYGDNYKERSNLIAVMELLAKENKINPSNTLIVEEGLHGNLNSYNDIRRSVQKFKIQHKDIISQFEKKTPKLFVGRDVKWLQRQLDNKYGVIIWGASGVGKTKLAKQFMNTWVGEAKVVDLRGINDIDLVYVEMLKCIGKPTSINDVSLHHVLSEFNKYTQIHKDILVLLDNADDFIKCPKDSVDHIENFATLVKKILKATNQSLKMIITSREWCSWAVFEENLHQQELQSLKKEDANSVIKANLLDKKEDESTINQAVDCCESLPLNLNILGAALQDQGITLNQLIPIVKKEAAKWRLKQKKAAKDTDVSTYGIMAARFERLSDTTQQSAVGLSLFTRSFSFRTVEQVFKSCDKQKVSLILNHLKHVNFITIEFDSQVDKSENIYDMHPKVKEFLTEKRDLPHIREYFLEVKRNFMTYFKDYMVNASQLIDADYLKGYEMYQDESSNLEFMLHDLQPELVLFDQYEDIQLIGISLRCMLKTTERLEFFQKLAKSLLQQGHKILGAQYLCQVALAESFLNPIKALEFTVLQVRHILCREQTKDRWKENKLFQEVSALYHYTKGEQLYHIAHSNHSEEDCKESIQELDLSIKIREEIYPYGHSDLVRSYISKGNGHNMMKDINDKESLLWQQNVDLALECYNKALMMRKNLSNSELHFDSPQIFENIGTILVEKRMYSEAEESFLRAIELEKQMKLDGLYNTTTKFVNIGALYQALERYDDAYEYYFKACELRKALKGNHKDTVTTIYRMAVAKHSNREFKEAILLYREAFFMDKGLPANYHSAVRNDIRKYMLRAMKSARKYEKDLAEKENMRLEIEEWQRKFQIMAEEEELKRLPYESVPTLVSGAAVLQKSHETVEKMEVDRPELALASASESFGLHDERSIRDFFDRVGGFIEFEYLGVYLSLPRCLINGTSLIEISRLSPKKVDLMLHQCEILVSDIILVKAAEFPELKLKSAALLEIPCYIANSNLHKHSHVVAIEYNTEECCWTELEQFSIFTEEKPGLFKSDEKTQVVYAWIKSFTMFALISKPTSNRFVIGRSGRICRPIESEDIEAAFAPKSFGDNECSCTMKVMMPVNETIQYCKESGCIVSPVLSINTSIIQLEKPVQIKIPLLCSPDQEGQMIILKQDDGQTSTWIDVTEIVRPELDKDSNAVAFQVTSFSFFLGVWTKTKEAALWAASFICSLAYDVVFHLYKGSGLDRFSDFPIALSCIPLTGSEQEQYDLRRRPEQDGRYLYVDSQPALERICDFEKVLVNVHGQFRMFEQDDIQKRLLKFNKNVAAPTKFRVIKNLNAGIIGGTVEIARQLHDDRLCNIPYFNNFVFTETGLIAEEERMWKSPFRFLGLRLDKCRLEDANMSLSGFRNRLHETGLDQNFIDGIKEAKELTNLESMPSITKKILMRITYYFKENKLSEGWFQVFEQYLWPQHTRDYLCQVMKFLEEELNDKKLQILHESIRQVASQSLVVNMAVKLCDMKQLQLSSLRHVTLTQTISTCRKDLLLTECLGQYRTALDIIRDLLRIENFPMDVEKVLDRIGFNIEKHLRLDS